MRCCWVLVALLASAACAASKPSARAETMQATDGPTYERVLPSFAVHPREVVVLDPRSAQNMRRPDARLIANVVDRFHELGDVRGEAAARIGRAAVQWHRGESRRAYEDVVEAQALFGEARDMHGLAKTYEWLGFMFDQSGAVDRAAEHFGVAYRLYKAVDDTVSERRVLSYAE